MAKVAQNTLFFGFFRRFTPLMAEIHITIGSCSDRENPQKTMPLHSSEWRYYGHGGVASFGPFCPVLAVLVRDLAGLVRFVRFLACSSPRSFEMQPPVLVCPRCMGHKIPFLSASPAVHFSGLRVLTHIFLSSFSFLKAAHLPWPERSPRPPRVDAARFARRVA